MLLYNMNAEGRLFCVGIAAVVANVFAGYLGCVVFTLLLVVYVAFTVVEALSARVAVEETMGIHVGAQSSFVAVRFATNFTLIRIGAVRVFQVVIQCRLLVEQLVANLAWKNHCPVHLEQMQWEFLLEHNQTTSLTRNFRRVLQMCVQMNWNRELFATIRTLP
jgi:hypothetical protein